MVHRHVWKITKQTEQPSQGEIMRDLGVTSYKGHGSSNLFIRSLIITYHCDDCGSDKVERI